MLTVAPRVAGVVGRGQPKPPADALPPGGPGHDSGPRTRANGVMREKRHTYCAGTRDPNALTVATISRTASIDVSSRVASSGGFDDAIRTSGRCGEV